MWAAEAIVPAEVVAGVRVEGHRAGTADWAKQGTVANSDMLPPCLHDSPVCCAGRATSIYSHVTYAHFDSQGWQIDTKKFPRKVNLTFLLGYQRCEKQADESSMPFDA